MSFVQWNDGVCAQSQWFASHSLLNSGWMDLNILDIKVKFTLYLLNKIYAVGNAQLRTKWGKVKEEIIAVYDDTIYHNYTTSS